MKILMLILFLLSFTSCTTVFNSQRRHDRIVKNFPAVHKSDTVEVEIEVLVKTPPIEIKGETIFEKCPEEGDSIVKNEVLKDGTTIKTTIKGNADGTKTVKTDIRVPEKEISSKTTVKQPVIYEPIKLKWWQNGWVIILFVVAAVFFGRFLCKFDEARREISR